MAELTIHLDGRAVRVAAGTSVAAAAWNHGVRRFRASVDGGARAPLCGMGVCFECRLTVDGRAHERTCILPCRDGMVIATAEGSAEGADHG